MDQHQGTEASRLGQPLPGGAGLLRVIWLHPLTVTAPVPWLALPDSGG